MNRTELALVFGNLELAYPIFCGGSSHLGDPGWSQCLLIVSAGPFWCYDGCIQLCRVACGSSKLEGYFR